MGSTTTAVRHAVRAAVHQHRQTVDGSAFSGILLGLLLVLPFWVGLVLLVRLLT